MVLTRNMFIYFSCYFDIDHWPGTLRPLHCANGNYVWNGVQISGVRSEKGSEKSSILVWNWVRVLRTVQHTPTQNFGEYTPPPPSRRKTVEQKDRGTEEQWNRGTEENKGFISWLKFNLWPFAGKYEESMLWNKIILTFLLLLIICAVIKRLRMSVVSDNFLYNWLRDLTRLLCATSL